MSFSNFLKIIIFIFLVVPAGAQPWFNWDYIGPDTIVVGNTCKAGLFWGGDNKIICTPVNPPDQVVIAKNLKSISDGYFEGNLIPGGTTVTVTYEAKDNQGHTEDFSFTIYFADKTPPVFNQASLPGDISITCASSLPSVSITATDNCTPAFQIQITETTNIPEHACSGAFQRFFTAKDLAGNISVDTQNITLLPETTPPVITTEAGNATYQCDSTDANTAFSQWINSHGGAVATDNCGIAGWTTIPASPQLSDACNTPTSVTFVVTDNCGNADSTTATFEIIDQQPPVLVSDAVNFLTTCANDIDSSLVQWLNNAGGSVITDNCLNQDQLIKTYFLGGVELTIAELQDTLAAQLAGPSISSVIEGVPYTGLRAYLPVEFHLSDYCNTGVTTSAVFAVIDTTAPVVLTPGVDTTTHYCSTGSLDELFMEWYNSGAGASGSDDCGEIIWAGHISLAEALDSLHSSPSLCNQTIAVTFRAKDKSGNVSIDSFISVYHIEDVSGPYFSESPQDFNLVCIGGDGVQDTLQNWIEVKAGAQIEDCNNAQWDHFEWHDNQGQSGTGLFGEGPYPQLADVDCSDYFVVYFYAKDDCSNISVDSASFNFADTIKPVASNIPSDTTITCDSPLPQQQPVFTDNCGISGDVAYQETSTQSNSLLDCSHYTYQITRTWTAVDYCGNSTTVTQQVYVIDTIAPTPDAPFDDLFLDCTDNIGNYLINFSDQCSFVQVEQSGSSTQSSDPAECSYYNYLVEQTYTVRDVCLNEKTYSRIITVSDDVAPDIDNSEPLVLNCTDSVQVAQVLKSLASDNCSNELSFSVQKLNSGNPDNCSSDNYQKWLLTASDPCGNTAEDTILVKLLDGIPPEIIQSAEDFVSYCEDSTDLPLAFTNWINNKAGSEAVDACGETFSFAALPGSYDLQNPASFPGQTPEYTDIVNCDGGKVGKLQVDFVYYDQCNNASVTSASFEVRDTIKPQLIACPDQVEIIAPAGQCSVDFQLQLPTVYDGCANITFDSTLSVVKAVTSVNPGNSLTPVSDVEILFADLATGGSFASFGSGVLDIEIQKGDIEASEEYFNIYDENNELLGQTNHSSTQCNSSLTQLNFTEAQFDNWVADGKIYFYAKPNDPSPLDGSYTINDICGGTTIRFALDVVWNHNPSLKYSFKVDTLAAQSFEITNIPVINLQEGHHTITYEISDCGNNVVTCTQQVFARDTIPPVIICGNDIHATLNGNVCDTLLTIPLPVNMDDNCGLANDFQYSVPADTASAWLTFAANPNLQNYIAQDKSYTFSQVAGNVASPVLLNVYLRGDIDSGGEYYTIYGEDGTALGITEAGQGNVLTGNCNKVSTAYFNIPPDKFNVWAQDGSITFNAVSNKDFNIPPGNMQSGINPCSGKILTMDGQTDSISFMFMELKYKTFTPPSFFATGATVIPFQQLAPPYEAPKFAFTAGTTHFSYTIEDRSGNVDTCTIDIVVRDTIAPVAVCKNAILHIHPSGIFPGILTPQMIDGGSYDNCTIDTMYVDKSLFNCSDIGSQQDVVLYVRDEAGLTDSCRTQVLIDKALLTPGYSLGLCDNDSLRLFSNLPDLDLFNQYIYSWTGPNNFSSNEANPVIPNASSINSGTYKLIVTGFNGCGGEGVVQVFINSEINTPIIGAKDTSVCQGQNIVLFTQTYTGNIKYKWYEGFAPNGQLLDSTLVPQYMIDKGPGTYYFYVIVSENDCVSNPSASVEVDVVTNPIALVDADLIQVCEGGVIALGSPMGTDFTYKWTGPNGFVSDQQYPAVISPALPVHSGIYSLIVSNGNCKSEPTEVQVLVSQRPEKPAPSSNSPVCFNSELRLKSNISAGVDTFIWKRPDGSLILTDTNTLIIPNAGTIDNGTWTLTLQSGGCKSLESELLTVEVTLDSNITITYDGPVCEGDSMRLSTKKFAGATYKWTGPGGFVSTLPEPVVVAAPGSYSVTVTTAAGCVFTSSVNLDLNPKPRISGLSSTAHDCQYPDETVTFNFTTNIPESVLTFAWKGPGGFNSTEAHPSIIRSELMNGVYSVVATSLQGCISDTTRVTVNNTIAPEQPIIVGSNKVCSGDTLVLKVSNLPNVGKYVWNTPNGVVTTTTNILTLINIQAGPTNTYSVVFESSGCQSRPSASFEVQVVQTPSRPVIIGDPTICLGDSIVLEISNPPDYEYSWTGPGGITSSQTKWVIFPSQLAHAGNYFLTLSNEGCVSKTSDAFTIAINQPPPAPNMADLADELCVSNAATVLTLCVTAESATANASYTFYNTALNTPVAGPTNGLCANVTNFSQLSDGINNFYAVATLNTCPSVPGIPVSIKLNYPPEEQADTDKEGYVCSGNEGQLHAKAPLFSVGKWSSPDPEVVIADPSDPNTKVTSLSKGKNVFIWSLDYNNCFNFSRDTMIIWVTDEQTANRDLYRIEPGQSIDMAVLHNDVFNTPVNIKIDQSPIFGQINIQNNETIQYVPNGSQNYDKFIYSICVVGCPEICSTAEVVVDIENKGDCMVPNIITPNHDGVNDFLRIPCLENSPVNTSKLAIFNEWGSQVFEASPYLNDWDGKYKGSDLPPGTYFFVFERGDQSPVQKGYLIIKR